MDDFGEFVVLSLIAAVGFFFFVIGIAMVGSVNEAKIGEAYMAPCRAQGFTETYCYQKAMKELGQSND